MIQFIADMLGMIGMGYFLWAEIRQWIKIRKHKTIIGISSHAYRNKIIAIITTCACFGLSGLWMSFLVLAAEGVVVVDILKSILKGRESK